MAGRRDAGAAEGHAPPHDPERLPCGGASRLPDLVPGWASYDVRTKMREAIRRVSALDPGSSPLAFFASELKRLRGAATMTQEALAEATLYSPATVAAVETARRIPSRDFAQRADVALSTDGILGRLQSLVEQTSVLPWFRDLVEIERRATEIRMYESYAVPGLLQTESYARYSVSATRPILTAAEIDRAVALRLTRQEIFDLENAPRLWAIMEESVLRRRVGGPEVMSEQLKHLLQMSERPNVVVQVIPEGEGLTAAGGRSFIMLTFASEPTVAYLEDLRSARYVRKGDEVSQYGLTFDHLRSNALPDDKSAALIRGEISCR
jgi:transcriptional regulator with XRE-family HTH domain